MFKFLVVLATLAIAAAFAPSARFAARSQLQMTAEKSASISKVVGAAIMASTFMGGLPSFAVEGAAPKQSYFGASASSPFAFDEKREDPLYSPYSPYGDGTAAAYKKGTEKEITYWTNKLTTAL